VTEEWNQNRKPTAQEAYDALNEQNEGFEPAAILVIDGEELIDEHKDGAWEREEEIFEEGELGKEEE
jgi:hypothetical protein